MTESTTRGGRLKRIRKHFRLNQEDFGAKISKSKGYISMLEKDVEPLTMAIIDGLNKSIAGLNIQWLLNGEGEMFIGQPYQDMTGSPITEMKEAPEKYETGKEGVLESVLRRLTALEEGMAVLQRKVGEGGKG